MKGIFYKTPLDFKAIKEKNKSTLTTINQSINQQILTILTNTYGECKFDEEFCANIWQIDFDQLTTDTSLKELIASALKSSIKLYEKRLIPKEVNVIMDSETSRKNRRIVMKKKITIHITGIIKESNRPYEYTDYVFVGPLSY